jgi:hypothetical protein
MSHPTPSFTETRPQETVRTKSKVLLIPIKTRYKKTVVSDAVKTNSQKTNSPLQRYFTVSELFAWYEQQEDIYPLKLDDNITIVRHRRPFIDKIVNDVGLKFENKQHFVSHIKAMKLKWSWSEFNFSEYIDILRLLSTSNNVVHKHDIDVLFQKCVDKMIQKRKTNLFSHILLDLKTRILLFGIDDDEGISIENYRISLFKLFRSYGIKNDFYRFINVEGVSCHLDNQILTMDYNTYQNDVRNICDKSWKKYLNIGRRVFKAKLFDTNSPDKTHEIVDFIFEMVMDDLRSGFHVILLGHSYGGLLVTHVVAKCIRAFINEKDGDSMREMFKVVTFGSVRLLKPVQTDRIYMTQYMFIEDYVRRFNGLGDISTLNKKNVETYGHFTDLVSGVTWVNHVGGGLSTFAIHDQYKGWLRPIIENLDADFRLSKDFKIFAIYQNKFISNNYKISETFNAFRTNYLKISAREETRNRDRSS